MLNTYIASGRSHLQRRPVTDEVKWTTCNVFFFTTGTKFLAYESLASVL